MSAIKKNQGFYESIKHKFGFDLKKEQLQIIEAVTSGKDVTAILPTGYGKSVGYILPPLIKDCEVRLYS